MIKALVKLVVAVLIANAIWRIGSAYMSYYRFKDAVADTAVNSKEKTDEELRDRVLELAAAYDEPVTSEALTIRREPQHTYIEAAYTKPITVLPGYEYQWPFSLNVDGFVIVPVKLGDLANPQ